MYGNLSSTIDAHVHKNVIKCQKISSSLQNGFEKITTTCGARVGSV